MCLFISIVVYYGLDESKNFIIIINTIAIIAVVLNINNSEVSAQNLTTNASSGITPSVNNETYSSINNNYQKSQIFTHGIVVKIDNAEYYFDGPADGANSTKKMHLVITGGKIHLAIYMVFITILVPLEKKIGGHLMQKVMNYCM